MEKITKEKEKRNKHISRFETIRKEIEYLTKIKRHKHHPVIHKIHYDYRISRKTIFYMKEYGPRSHVASVIIKESFKILILASIISSIGGLTIETIQPDILTIIPLLILLPALNNMIGSFGAIASSKFTVLLYLGKANNWWRSREVHKLFTTIFIIALISSFFLGLFSYVVSLVRGFQLNLAVLFNIITMAVASTMILVTVIFLISIIAGFYIFKKEEDPSNFLIPITTSIGDLGSMVIFSIFVTVLF